MNTDSDSLKLHSHGSQDRLIALAGNPNVGKSTLFNNLTHLNQHTGNWPGKTVTAALGCCRSGSQSYTVADLPGTYSLLSHSPEEEAARNFLCFDHPDGVVVVCDAVCLERNLNLVLQILEITPHVLVCVNLMDEAERKHIQINLSALSQKLGVPVIGTTARNKSSALVLKKALDSLTGTSSVSREPFAVRYAPAVEEAAAVLNPVLSALEYPSGKKPLPVRWLSLRLLDHDTALSQELNRYFETDFLEYPEIASALTHARQILSANHLDGSALKDSMVSSLVHAGESICASTVQFLKSDYNRKDQLLDRILTGHFLAYPAMFLLLALIFWITITGANYLSGFLSAGLFQVQDWLSSLFHFFHAPAWLHDMAVLGAYRVLAWVISVMLPPMAIFFPLFTLLEDAGYLPRIAYNLDKPFQCCRSCGKQALCMCMGLGCNAVGVEGCRIIDSPRERLIAILTNSFIPCNGRFPTLIALITMFFVGTGASGRFPASLYCALFLSLFLLLGILMTFAVSALLSHTVLKGVPSSFTLELPPYRRPRIGQVIVRSVLDRTLFVLGRAAAVAAPAGLLLWLLSAVTIQDVSLLQHIAGFLDPFARLLGMDGVILTAFLLGLPANEIVLPIIIMIYLSQGSIQELNDLSQLHMIFINNGWTTVTAVCTMLFSLMHWPCSTTLLTIKKETGSIKWTIFSALLPAFCGMIVCFLFHSAACFFLS